MANALVTQPPLERRVFCNRTLNLRSIRAIGYDMDYTLVHYRVEEWERKAYTYLRDYFAAQGWPVGHLEFDPDMVCRGLVIDAENGNLVKANRFGFVKRAMHGTRAMDFGAQRDMYSRIIVDLADRRWEFMNTLFSLSEGCFYAQLVDLLDERKLPDVLGYDQLYRKVRSALDALHMEGRLKAEIIADPDRYVMRDEEMPLALLDQHHAGKKLMLITNSEWHYTMAMMNYAFDPFLPKGMSWKSLFDLVIVGARKPSFFTSHSPFFEIVTQEGLLKPGGSRLRSGVAYLGGSARHVEEYLGISGDEILYVGDHMFGDVHVTKSVLRWRTALILREMEEEIQAVEAFNPVEPKIAVLMAKKEEGQAELCQLRLDLQRVRLKYGPQTAKTERALDLEIGALRATLEALDDEIAPLARAATELSNPNWGLLMRAGNDKSYLAYQVERYADIYTSRVSNLLYATPFAYLRSPRGSLPHDMNSTGFPG